MARPDVGVVAPIPPPPTKAEFNFGSGTDRARPVELKVPILSRRSTTVPPTKVDAQVLRETRHEFRCRSAFAKGRRVSCLAVQKGGHSRQVGFPWQLFHQFPSRERCWIDLRFHSQALLAPATGFPESNQPHRNRLRYRTGIISEKFQDRWNPLQLRLSSSVFPQPNACHVSTELRGNVTLKEAEVHPALSKMLAKSFWRGRIAFWLGLLGLQDEVADWQHTHAGTLRRLNR